MLLMQIISYALVLHSIVPLRSEPNEGAEQETQLMFGETCKIIEEERGWCKVQNDYDGQVGWVDAIMITRLTEDEYKQYTLDNRDAVVIMPMAYCTSEGNVAPLSQGRAPLTQYPYPLSTNRIPLCMGSHLSNYRVLTLPDGKEIGTFNILGSRFTIDPQAVAPKPLPMTKENFMMMVSRFLNVPYLWGGKSCIGLDCSGFSGVLLNIFGKSLLRNAREQVTQGTEVPSLSEAQFGDLVFFNHESQNPEATKITHVGVLISPDTVVHCSGRVKIEPIDEQGIFSFERGKHYTHDLKAIKRY